MKQWVHTLGLAALLLGTAAHAQQQTAQVSTQWQATQSFLQSLQNQINQIKAPGAPAIAPGTAGQYAGYNANGSTLSPMPNPVNPGNTGQVAGYPTGGNTLGPLTNISGVNVNGVVNVQAYGARCDGTTDDTTAFLNAVAAAQGGGTAYVPATTTGCLMNANGINFHGYGNVTIKGARDSLSGGYASRLIIAGQGGSGAACTGANNTGGIYNIGAGVTFSGVAVAWSQTGTAPDCLFNLSNGQRLNFIDSSFTSLGQSLPATNPVLFYENGASGNAQMHFIHNTIDGSFRQDWLAVGAADNWEIARNSVGFSQDAPNPLYMLQANIGEAFHVHDNNFEIGPNVIATSCSACEVNSNLIADAPPALRWAATHAYAAQACVTPTTYLSTHTSEFCTTSGGTSGGSEPAWPSSGTITDGSVTWTYEGAGAGIVYNGSGSIHDNVLGSRSGGSLAAGIWVNPNATLMAPMRISGNSIAGSAVGLWVNNSLVEIDPNSFYTGAGGIELVVGDGTTAVKGIRLANQLYTNSASQSLFLQANTGGVLDLNAGTIAGAFTNNAASNWTSFWTGNSVITNFIAGAGTPTISGGGTFVTGSNSTTGDISGAAATGNVFSPGFTCAHYVIGSFMDINSRTFVAIAGRNTTSVTFGVTTAGDNVDYSGVGCV